MSGCQGLEIGGGIDHKGAAWGIFQSDGTILYLDCGNYMTLSICQNS